MILNAKSLNQIGFHLEPSIMYLMILPFRMKFFEDFSLEKFLFKKNIKNFSLKKNEIFLEFLFEDIMREKLKELI